MAKLLASFRTAPSSWSTTTDCCKWKNVNCDGSNRVTSINLVSQSLIRTLPSNLDALTKLTTLSPRQLSFWTSPFPCQPHFSPKSLHWQQLRLHSFRFLPRTHKQTLTLSQNLNLAPWTIFTELTQATVLVTSMLAMQSLLGLYQISLVPSQSSRSSTFLQQSRWKWRF